MASKRRLLARVCNNSRDVRFTDLLTLVEAFGFEFLRQEGSHRQFEHPTTDAYLYLQPDKHGKAKRSRYVNLSARSMSTASG